MARLPCSFCHRVPIGALPTVILAWYNDSGRVARKIRVCKLCLPEASKALGEPALTEGDYVQLPTLCPLCQEPILAEELREVYSTTFGDGETQRDIYYLCLECAAPRLAEYASAGEPMVDRPLYKRR